VVDSSQRGVVGSATKCPNTQNVFCVAPTAPYGADLNKYVQIIVENE